MSECRPTYEPLPDWSFVEMQSVLERADPLELTLLPLVAGLMPPNRDWTLEMCIRLTEHPDAYIRGNALLGIGYLAHTYKDLPKEPIRSIVKRGLQDDDPGVRQRAEEAIEELSGWLEWRFPRRK